MSNHLCRKVLTWVGVLSAGEMVLLLHWSLLNYAAVVKILKKHGELP